MISNKKPRQFISPYYPIKSYLMLDLNLNAYTTLDKIFNKLKHFSYFSLETGYDISFKTVCTKCQILFSGKNKKNISICHLLKVLPGMIMVQNNSDKQKGIAYQFCWTRLGWTLLQFSLDLCPFSKYQKFWTNILFFKECMTEQANKDREILDNPCHSE